MWTRGRDKENPGKFAYTLYCNREIVEHVGGFGTYQEADRAAEAAERILAASGYDIVKYRATTIMSDDEILAALLE